MLEKTELNLTGSQMFGSQGSVLRNTYLLLALTLIPTILGAIIGVQFRADMLLRAPLVGFLIYLVIAFGFIYAIEKYKNSGAGVLILLGFTFFMGVMLSAILRRTLAFSNGAELIGLAIGGTSLMMLGLGSFAASTKRDFSAVGKWASISLLVIIAVSIANIFLRLPLLHLIISIAAMLIFSAYLVYDVQKVVNGGERNYISATLSIYLDIYNLFVNLLSILGIAAGKRD